MPKQVRFSLNRKLASTTPDGSPEVKYGVLEDHRVYEVPGRGASHSLDDVRLLPPCWPTKIVCVGRNYRDHAAEFGNDVPAEPLIFLKPPSALAAHGDPVLYPSLSERVDHEAELGVVIGRRARNVKKGDADAYILGYTCINDVTARDLQFKDQQWTRSKSFDTFCPVGPWVVTRDEVAFDKIVVRALVDNEKKQEASIADMVFPVGEIIEYITRVMTLEPGDLIATGTPSGVSAMQPGSVVRVEVEGVGALENRVVKP